MRGPHNIWRLVRTGATFERTGAMRVASKSTQRPPIQASNTAWKSCGGSSNHT